MGHKNKKKERVLIKSVNLIKIMFVLKQQTTDQANYIRDARQFSEKSPENFCCLTK